MTIAADWDVKHQTKLSSVFHSINPFFLQIKTQVSQHPSPQRPPLAGPYSILFASIIADSYWVGVITNALICIKLYVFDHQNNAFEYERLCDFVCLFDLILYVPSTLFQL